MPGTYVLVYAPRSGEEVEVAMEVVKAGVGYMAGTEGKDLK